MKLIRKAALAVIEDGKVLMVRSYKHPEVLLSLGGKIEEGETELECLVREVKEEVSAELDQDNVQFLAEFDDMAYGKNETKLELMLFRGELLTDTTPAEEISGIEYVDSDIDPSQLTPMGKQIIAWLKQHQLIS